ncbi:MAG: hypothetical protein LUG99_09520 [Lachnospiraceae bacterium]|nr:hypothetical protein [Lachnospiraceae bacterium]
MEIKSSKKKNRRNSGCHPQCRRTGKPVGNWDRRILSLLVALCMFCASVPVFVSSEETEYLPSETVLAEADMAAAVAETSGSDEPADNAATVSETEAVTEVTTETEETTESETSAVTEAATETETTAATEAETESITETEEAEETGATTEAETEATTEGETSAQGTSENNSENTEASTDRITETMTLTGIGTSADTGTESETEALISVASVTASDETLSVTITWSAMEFTYTDSKQEWDPDTHTYKTVSEGGWTADVTDGGKVTVANDGSVDIIVNYSFALDAENSAAVALSGTFAADSSGTELTESSPVVSTDDTTTAWLVLSGIPKEDMTAAKIGSVTVTITEADTEQESE